MELPRTNQTFFELHVPRLLTLPVLPRLGRWGLAVIADTGSRRLSSSACNTLSAFAGDIHLLARVPCLYISVANPQHHLFRTLLSLCAAQCSIHLLISSHILSLVYFPLSMADVPHSTLGRVCMGGDSPCFSRGHCRVLINPPGRNFPCPRACGLLPLPLLGHGTCHWVHRG